MLDDDTGAGTARVAAPTPWLVSAPTEPRLRLRSERILAHLEAHPDLSPIDVGFSLATAPPGGTHRAAVVAGDRDQLLHGLRMLAAGRPAASVVRGTADRRTRPVFVFPGQGGQWPGMAADLLKSSPVFARHLTRCEEALAPHVDWSLSAVLRAAAGAPSLERVDVVQPALWAVMVSLAGLWRAFGVEPVAVVGQSQGEIVAAHVAGALSLEDTARVMAVRSRLVTAVSRPSGMAAVGVSATQAESLLRRWNGRLTVAASNGPATVVVSGDAAALNDLAEECAASAIRFRRIAVDYASHSPYVEVVRERLLDALTPITPGPADVPLVSTVTGDIVDGARLDATYWYRNERDPVRLERAVRLLLRSGPHVFIEVSPHPVLTTAVEQTIESCHGPARASTTVESLRRGEDGMTQFTTSLARAFVHGVAVDWAAYFAGYAPRPVDLPPAADDAPPRHLGTPPPPSAATADPPPAPPGEPAPFARRLAARTPAGRDRLLTDLVRDETAAVLRCRSTDIAPVGTFQEMGLDSATAVELRNRLVAATGHHLPTTLVFDHPSPAALARAVGDHLLGTARAETTSGPVSSPPDEPVAIVGIGCRFPGGVSGPEELWDLVSAAAETVSTVPTDRGWDLDVIFGTDPERPGRSYVRHGSFLDDVGGFDAEFFGISPGEARMMDPQQRVLLEVAWETFERAGIAPTSLHGTRTGVFVGGFASEYGPLLHDGTEDTQGLILTGNATSVLSGRISYILGLEGPAVTVDTACSSSLVAVHQAVRALRAGDCALALAGGVTVMANPGMFVEFSRHGALAPDGRCKAFAAAADGTGWSEGAGLLLLERLTDARENNHPVLATIRGSAVNQDGASNGLTAPNGRSQERVIRAALADARLSSVDVDVVEAHGTGTTLGDPIEARAVLATYGRGRPADRPLWLGSLKSNIGHTQAASGVAGVVKMVLALRHGVVPQTLNVDAPSPHVDWSGGAVELLTESRSWPEVERPRRAAVSSFGVSGTNAHLILEETPPPPATSTTGPTRADTPARRRHPWVLSARSSAALYDQAERLGTVMATNTDARTSDIGFSLATTRAVHRHRAVVLGTDPASFRRGLGLLAHGERATEPPGPTVGYGAELVRPVLVFPGQGSQWVGMGRGLLGGSSEFVRWVGLCEEALGPWVGWSLSRVLRGEVGVPGLERADVVQPVLWAVMVSLGQLWRSVGVEPAAVVGHSQGEIAAACVAGALSLEDGAKVVALRSRVVRGLAGSGAMATVGLPVERVRGDLAEAGDVHVAAINGPTTTVVAGQPGAVRSLTERYAAEGITTRRVEVDYASHTPHVEPLRARILDALADVTPRRPAIPFYSTMTAGPDEGPLLDADYWYRSLREPVRFHPTIRALAGSGHNLFVEASPHPTLVLGVQQTIEADGRGDAAVVGTLRRGADDWDAFLGSVSEAFVHGADVDWASFYTGQDVRRVPLPTYPFQRRRYWLDGPRRSTAPGPVASGEPVPPPPPETNDPAPRLRSLPSREREDAVHELVRARVAEVLGHAGPAAVDVHRGFLEAGGTSLAAIQLRNLLQRETGLDLPVTVAFDHPTPDALARHLLTRVAAEDTPPDLLEELDRIEAALARGAVDDTVRRRVAERLRGVLRALDDGGDLAARHDGSRREEPRRSRDDQLLELINQALGPS